MKQVKTKDNQKWYTHELHQEEEIYEIYREVWRDKLYENNHCKVESGDVVVDVGANIGIFSRYAFYCGASLVIGIDPGPAVKEPYRVNTSGYFLPIAVLDISGEDVAFFSTPYRPGTSRLGATADEERVQESEKIIKVKVPVTTLDLLLRDYGKISFIKMDIEGSELKALAGAEQTIKRFKPKMAIACYHNSTDRKDILDLVKSFGMGYNDGFKDIGPWSKTLLFW